MDTFFVVQIIDMHVPATWASPPFTFACFVRHDRDPDRDPDPDPGPDLTIIMSLISNSC